MNDSHQWQEGPVITTATRKEDGRYLLEMTVDPTWVEERIRLGQDTEDMTQEIAAAFAVGLGRVFDEITRLATEMQLPDED